MVTAISYGGNAHIVFSKVNIGFRENRWQTLNVDFQNIHVDYDKLDIEGYLEAKVEMKGVAVPVDIEGSFEIKYEDNLERSKNSTSIKVCLFISY